jgi:hypothetical protein
MSGADMTGFHTLAFFLVAIVAIAATDSSGYAQTSPAGIQPHLFNGKSTNIAVDLVLPKKQIPAGQTPWAFLTVKNLGGNVTIAFPQDRVHVEGETGEPPTTLYQRQVTHKLRPGERELRMGGFEPEIWPTFSSDRKYDLSQYYDLSKPGKYTVYIEVLDVSASETKHGAGLWVRSKTAQFEMLAPEP